MYTGDSRRKDWGSVIHPNSMTVSSVASRSYLTDTTRHYSDRGYLVVVSELVLGRASDVGSSSYSVRLQNENEIPTIHVFQCTHMSVYYVL